MADEETNGSPTFVRISQQMVYTELQACRKDIASLQTAFDKADMPGQARKIRALEMRFYGLLAGVITALTVIIVTGVPGR